MENKIAKLLNALLETTEEYKYYGYVPDGSKEICSAILLIGAEQSAKIAELEKRAEIGEKFIYVLTESAILDWLNKYLFYDYSKRFGLWYVKDGRKKLHFLYQPDKYAVLYAILEHEFEQKAEGGEGE